MEEFFTKRAKRALEVIVEFIESKNTPGSGRRFALKFEEILNQYALENTTYAKCNHISLY